MYILHVETASHPNSLLGICVHHCVGSNPSRGLWRICQWLGVGWWFSLCTLVFCTITNWLVTTSLWQKDVKINEMVGYTCSAGGGGGFWCLCRVQKYYMLSNAHGDHRGSICPQCRRRPKHILRAVSLCGNAQISVSTIDQWKLMLFTRPRPSWRAFIEDFFCTRHKHRNPSPCMQCLN